MASFPVSSRLKKHATRWINLALSLVLILACSVPIGSAQAAPPPISAGQSGGMSGVSWTGPAGVSETTAQIMARQAQTPASVQPPAVALPPLRANPAGKTSAGAQDQGPLSAPKIPNAPDAFSLGISFDGPGSTTNLCGTPPDTMGTVGPTQFIIFVNCNIVSYDKTTGVADGVLSTTPNLFFNSVRSAGVSDPHIRYDRLSQRWFVVMIDVTFPNNRVLIAMSDTATITNATVWKFFFFQSAFGTHTNCLADYPTPGIDANAIYIGVNQFCGASLGTANYAGSDGYIVQKSSLLGGGPIHGTSFSLGSNVSGLYTPQGVDNADPSAIEGYFIGVDNAAWNKLDLIRVSSPGSASPTLSAAVQITIANLGNQITQPHKGNTGGTSGNLDASDNRLFAATLRDGQLWTATGVGVTASGGTCSGTAAFTGATRDALFWWQIHNIASGQTPQIVQSGQVCDTSATNPSFYSYGTIAPNGQGHAALGYTIAGANNFIEPGVSLRLASDPAGTLPVPFISPTGTHPYNPAFDSGATNGFRRWGDFSYTSLDPCDDMTLWTIQEYANPDNQFRERVTQLVAPPPAAPASANPPAVATGQASVSVAITGASSSGSGFYDTPASMSAETCRKRLSATVSNGAVVNGVTFTDPTHLSLSLDTTGATSGLATVTIKNPDGQSLGAAILEISATLKPTSTLLVPAPSPSVFGQSVGLTATVSGSGGTPTGTVSFFDGATLLGSATLSGGVATFSTSSLAVGTHANLTAQYAGDTSFSGSTSPAASQTVSKAGTSLALQSGPSPSVIGQTVTLTATLNVFAPGAGTPTGSVSFFDGFTLLGSATLSSGVATLSTSTLAVGGHNLNAQYAGDSSFSGSTSPPALQTVDQASTSLAFVTAPNPAVLGQTVTLTATLSVNSPGVGTPTGSVSFFDSLTLLGSATLSGGVATFNTSTLAVGSHNLTAQYSGDSSFSGSTSPISVLTVNRRQLFLPLVKNNS